MTMQNPKIFHDNRLADGTPAASTTATGYNVLNLRDFRPYTWWKPTAMPATVTVDCGSAVYADSLFLFNHVSRGCSYEVHGSNDNFAGQDVLCGTLWADADEPKYLAFTSAAYRYWRLVVLGAQNLFQYSEQFDNAYWTKTRASILADVIPAPLAAHESNLLLYSEQFDNAAWIKAGVTVSPDATYAPNDALVADTIVEDTGSNRHTIYQSTSLSTENGVMTFSVFAKPAAGTRYLTVYLAGGGFQGASRFGKSFDLATATTGTGTDTAGVGVLLSNSIEAMDNGFYRVSITGRLVGAATTVYACIGVDNTFGGGSIVDTYTGDGASGFHLYGAQLENDGTLSRYKVTTSAAVTALSEADAWVEDATASNTHQIARSQSFVIGRRYSTSIYIRSRSGNRRLTIFSASAVFGVSQAATFDPDTGAVISTVGGVDASMVALADGWYRCTLTTIAAITTASQNVYLYLTEGTSTSYSGDGASGLYIFGAQLEAAPNPSDYIKTTTAAIDSPPLLSIAAIGTALEFPKSLPYGFAPTSRTVKGTSSRSESGQPLGRSIDFEEWRATLSWANLDESFVRDTFLPAWKSSLRGQPFGFAWDAGDHPTEIYLVTAGDKVDTPANLPLKRDLRFDVTGVALT